VGLTGDFVDSDFAGDFVSEVELSEVELSEFELSEEGDFEPEESFDDVFFAAPDLAPDFSSARLSLR